MSSDNIKLTCETVGYSLDKSEPFSEGWNEGDKKYEDTPFCHLPYHQDSSAHTSRLEEMKITSTFNFINYPLDISTKTIRAAKYKVVNPGM